MNKNITRSVTIFLFAIAFIAQPSIASSDSLPTKAIVEGGECQVLNEAALLPGSSMKVSCVEKDKRLIWTTNPEIYRQLNTVSQTTPCEAECQADRKGIAQGEVEAADAKTYFPKWVTDAQKFFSNLVLKKVKEAFGQGEYSYINPMPVPSQDALNNPSTSTFGAYKLTLKNWSEAELIGLNQSRFQSAVSENSLSNKVNSPTSSIKLAVDKSSEGKYLIAVFSNISEESITLKASKGSAKQISIVVNTDRYGYGSILTSQKLSGYKLLAGGASKSKASTTVK
jgi:hypothetical protein